jgi:phosphatidylglycerol:prolipoprotein diacylglycerol transferase
MYPVLFEFGFIRIYSYGLMVALAFFISTFLLGKKAATLGFKEDFFWNLSFWVLLGGLLGGRLIYIILNPGFFFQDPLEVFKVWHGGLVWYGGLLGGISGAFVYLKARKIPLLRALDIIVPFAALGQSIGRIGCFLNGCCYGRSAVWGMYFPVHNDYLIPIQLFSSLDLLAIFILLRFLQERTSILSSESRRHGCIFITYLLLLSLERFLMEFLRDDSSRSFFGLTVFQIISAVIFLAALLALWSIILRSRRKMRSGA